MSTKKELLELELLMGLECSDVVSISLSDGSNFSIGVASYWLGGSDEGFMCDMLGNIEYSSKEACVNALFASLRKDNIQIVEIDC